MEEPRLLDDSERQAWKSLVTVVNVGIPQIERTFRQHGLVHIEYAVLAVLSERPRGMRRLDNWLLSSADFIGREYASELDRHWR